MSYLGVDNPFEMATPTPKQARPWTELAAHAARPARPGVAEEGKSAEQYPPRSSCHHGWMDMADKPAIQYILVPWDHSTAIHVHDGDS